MNNTTLTDRLLIGFASGVTATITSGIIWLLFAVDTSHIMLPSMFVWGSGVIGFAMGFLVLENHLLNLLAKIWHFIYRYLGWWA